MLFVDTGYYVVCHVNCDCVSVPFPTVNSNIMFLLIKGYNKRYFSYYNYYKLTITCIVLQYY